MGIYHAELLVTGDDLMLVRRELSFMRYPDIANIAAQPRTRLRHRAPRHLRGTHGRPTRSAQRLGVEYVKLPIWSPRSAADQTENRAVIEDYLEVGDFPAVWECEFRSAFRKFIIESERVAE